MLTTYSKNRSGKKIIFTIHVNLLSVWVYLKSNKYRIFELMGKIKIWKSCGYKLLPKYSTKKSYILLFRLILYICSFFTLLGLCCCMGLALVVVSRGSSLVVACGLLITVASRCRAQAPGYTGSAAVACGSAVAVSWFWSTGSIVVIHGFGCSVTCWIIPDHRLNLCLLYW